ncbi:MAG: hypothetical protein AMXMBFR82_11200 [Candidatus Hydrogenedentota bacterium]
MLVQTIFALAIVAAAAPAELTIESFDGPGLPLNLKMNNTDATLIDSDKGQALQVHFQVVDWPNVYFSAPEGTWDWSRARGLAVDVFNPGQEAVNVAMRVDNPGTDGGDKSVTGQATALPGEWTELRTVFGPASIGPFWGMRGIPVAGPVGTGKSIDAAAISAFQVFLPRPNEEAVLIIDNVRLFGDSASTADQVPLPFIDRFGQYEHETWPGKLDDASQWADWITAEEGTLHERPVLPGRDAYGGWAEGPKREATGWFRTEQIDGKWWFVTPEGHLFLSMGMDCVGTWSQTFVEQRETWFHWLPAADDPVFGRFYGNVSGAHSMAETIGGEGRTFGFYAANLARKYGEAWPERWRETTCRRLNAWGFNTIGNWSQGDFIAHCELPYVATAGVHGTFRRIEGGGGYWAKMPDVYDPDFDAAAKASVTPAAKSHAGNPRCIGLFVDNEMSWEAIRIGTLASPADQPCRIAQIDMLKERYGLIDALNAAWETNAADWDALRVPDRPNAACDADLEAFVFAFAHRYFALINDAIKAEAPHLLYLGCRFSTAPEAVVKACADVADVVSFNLYYPQIRPDFRTGDHALGKPVLIGEFHFGALDRGMFHPGLVGTADQADRAKSFARYVRSVVDHPAFVGCHWFQYVDEPTTGRWYDGENYNIGFVSVVDAPYPEMVESAKTVFGEMYERRYRSDGGG